MSDQLNENNNEINKAIEAETIEKESQPVEESSIEATIKEETKETEKNKQTEESKKTVEANIKTGKKCPIKSNIYNNWQGCVSRYLWLWWCMVIYITKR